MVIITLYYLKCAPLSLEKSNPVCQMIDVNYNIQIIAEIMQNSYFEAQVKS